ncbi:RNA polymerase sigma-70 factor [Chitinophaga defluvii]|uniref:RNA polymerase sigma-70 factor n=1 Tax=Chitinophaga defluvii TaxID=3163343 RepID=A0ABV2T4U8_9BACT
MEELLYRIQFKDDQLAFKAFYQQQVFRLFQFAYTFIKNRQMAEEVVNDVFVKLWEKRKVLDKISNMKVYLYVAVKHTALNHLRTVIPFQELDLDNVHVQHFQLSLNAEQLLLTNELQQAIAAAIQQLPPKCKLIFKLVKEDGLSYSEVADILGIATKTVDAQLVIALKKLSHLLQPFLQRTSSKKIIGDTIQD